MIYTNYSLFVYNILQVLNQHTLVCITIKPIAMSWLAG